MPHLTETDFKDSTKDSYWKDFYTNEGNKLTIKKETVEDFAKQGLPESHAKDHAESVFNSEFNNELRDISQFKQSILAQLPTAHQDRDNKKTAVEDIISQGKDVEHTGMRIEIPPFEKNAKLIAEIGAYGLFIAGLASTAIFLHDQAGFDWWKAFTAPLAGVTVLVLAIKFALRKLASEKSKLFPIVTWSTLIIGIACAIAWFVFYAEFAGSVSKGPSFESFDGATQTSNDHGPILMIIFGGLAEALVGAFLFQCAHSIILRYTYYDKVIETQLFKKAKEDLEKAQSKVDDLEGRTIYADSLWAILESVKERLENDANEVYKLTEASRRKGTWTQS
jgi:hypothetical protein